MTDRQSAPLTPTETQTLNLLATGLRPYEIAQRLGLNTATVRNTVARARRKYNARDLHHAVQIHTTQQVTE